MATLRRHKLVSMFIAVAVVTAPLLVATQAEAANGLFRMKRIWWGGTPITSTTTTPQGATNMFPGVPDPYISVQYHPRPAGPNKAAAAAVTVGNNTLLPAPNFTAPSKFIVDYTYYGKCVPGTCAPGYPQSKAWYSYWNLNGSFRPNNSRFGGAATATTVRFATTNPQIPPMNQGNPVTPTTTPCVGDGTVGGGCGYLAHDLGTRMAGDKISFVDGKYDFSRAGSIMVTPGTNRFGGTMHFFYGPNHVYYQLISINSPHFSKAYGPQMDVRDPDANTVLGSVQYGGPFNIYRLTPGNLYRLTTGPPDYGYYSRRNPYFYTLLPFTTGMVSVWEPFGVNSAYFTLTGYDNRTALGLNGNISMIRARLVHTYSVPRDPSDPIEMTWASGSAWQMTFHFLPEPGSTVMMASGLVVLAGLYRLRRR